MHSQSGADVSIPVLTPFIVFLQLSHSWTLPIGSLVVPIRELLSEPELVLDQWFHLDGASPESQVLLRAELMVGELSICFIVIFYIRLFVIFNICHLSFFLYFNYVPFSVSVCNCCISLSLSVSYLFYS